MSFLKALGALEMFDPEVGLAIALASEGLRLTDFTKQQIASLNNHWQGIRDHTPKRVIGKEGKEEVKISEPPPSGRAVETGLGDAPAPSTAPPEVKIDIAPETKSETAPLLPSGPEGIRGRRPIGFTDPPEPSSGLMDVPLHTPDISGASSLDPVDDPELGLTEEEKAEAKAREEAKRESIISRGIGVASGVIAVGAGIAEMVKPLIDGGLVLPGGVSKTIKEIIDKLPDEVKDQLDRNEKQHKIDEKLKNMINPYKTLKASPSSVLARQQIRRGKYQLPDPRYTHNSVNLVRRSNANYVFVDNMFNTKF